VVRRGAPCGHDAWAEHERYRLNRQSAETIFRRFRQVAQLAAALPAAI
jgi:hypothetical protein